MTTDRLPIIVAFILLVLGPLLLGYPWLALFAAIDLVLLWWLVRDKEKPSEREETRRS